MHKMEEVKFLELTLKVKGNKNVSTSNVKRVLLAIPRVIKKMLLDKKEIVFSKFLKLGFRQAKDRIVKSRLTNEYLHMPEHLRFKTKFSKELKDYMNK